MKEAKNILNLSNKITYKNHMNTENSDALVILTSGINLELDLVKIQNSLNNKVVDFEHLQSY